jgi:hypothetical protein
MASIVITPPQDWNPSSCYIFYASDTSGAVQLPYKMINVPRKCKTAEEIRDKRSKYRKEYSKRPEVQQKIKERLMKPEVAARRKAYAEREEVKRRKQVLAARARAVKNRLKEENPQLYNQIINEIECEV